MFKNNVGGIDRIARIVLGVVLIAAFFMVEGQYSWLYLLGIIPLATGLMGSCPLYTIIGLNTCPTKK